MKQSQDKLGELPIGKLLVTMSAPMMISMFIQALYNVVDSMFVARLSEDALTAVSLAFPLQNVITSIAVGTSVGLNALVSRSLGEGNQRRAEKAVNVYLFLSVVYAALTLLLGFFARNYYAAQTDVESIIHYGTEYVSVVCFLSLGVYLSQGLEKLLIATGNPTPSMIAQGVGAVLNIILDPIFIFGLGPVPALGAKGAAVATVIGQWSAGVCAFFFNLKYNKATRFDLRQILPDLKILRFIYTVGLPSMLTIGLTAIMGYLMNGVFLRFSTTAAAVFGIWLKLQNFGFMPVFGMNNGTVAIYSYNYGAKKLDRVFGTLRLSLIVAVCVTLAVTLLYELIPNTLLGLFSASDYMRSIGVHALRITVLSLVFGACSVMISSFMQSLGYAPHSLIITVSRQVVFQVTAAWLLSKTGKLELVWFAPLIAEVLGLIVAAFICLKIVEKLRGEQAEIIRTHG